VPLSEYFKRCEKREREERHGWERGFEVSTIIEERIMK
jgi:hypothetical protein